MLPSVAQNAIVFLSHFILPFTAQYEHAVVYSKPNQLKASVAGLLINLRGIPVTSKTSYRLSYASSTLCWLWGIRHTLNFRNHQ